MKNIALFCGARLVKKEYEKVAQEFCDWMIKHQFTLVYGGGSGGVMGFVARNMKENGIKVIGVIPEALVQLEVANKDCDELIIVDSMHTRKQIMFNKSDAFVTLPGGFGTLDEICEIITWKQLNFHTKSIGFLNSNNYFDQFKNFISFGVDEGFISKNDYMDIQWLKSMKDFNIKGHQ